MSLTNDLSRCGTCSKAVGCSLHLLHQLLAVAGRRQNLIRHILNLTNFLVGLESFLHFVVLRLQLGISHLNGAVANLSIGEGCQENVALSGLCVESSLSRNGVRQLASTQQSLILTDEQILTQGLFNVLPERVEALILLSNLRVVQLLLHHVQQIAHLIIVETLCLRVDELLQRKLTQHRVGSFLQHILQFLVGNSQSQFVGLVLHHLIDAIELPNLIAKTVEFIFRQVVATLGQLHDFLALVYESLEVLY